MPPIGLAAERFGSTGHAPPRKEPAMKPDSKSITFRGLADELRRGCASRGIDLNDGVAELILADRINALAGLFRGQ